MHKLGWYDQPPNLSDVPTEYTVNMNGGNWHVSQAAHAAYQWTPLTSYQDGYAPVYDQGDPLFTNFYLVAPGELEMNEPEAGGFRTVPSFGRDGLDVRVVLGPLTPEQELDWRDQIIDDRRYDLSLSSDAEIEDPPEKIMSQLVRQRLLHQVLDDVEPTISDYLTVRTQDEFNQGVQRAIREGGLALASGLAVWLGIDLLDNMKEVVIADTVSLTVAGALILNSIRQHLKHQRQHGIRDIVLARRTSTHLIDQIHDIYCARRFDTILGNEFRTEN